jgi:HPt (histidine-containing phosphotransfer) domain-containing protein
MNTLPTRSSPSALFDANRLPQELESDDQTLLESLYKHYQSHISAIIEALHKAINTDQDLVGAASLAHSVRASSISMGAGRVAELMTDLETHCEQGDSETCQQLLAQLEEAWPATCQAMCEAVM